MLNSRRNGSLLSTTHPIHIGRSLCIIQDNPHDKYLHINNMDRIYQRAVPTIVSAARNDANAGLPAFRYDSLYLNESVAAKRAALVRIQERLVVVVLFSA